MARYSVVRLNINGKDLIGVENLRDVERNALSTQNAIYIYRGTKTQKIYILVRQLILRNVTSSIIMEMKKSSTQEALIRS